ncbi:hypothetical protein EMPS_07474 [Entomortierella parvispora]|uniref:F-box domain-containing protein n=1 Tax=Entomortierella parvispora TaxID=205924 RepID=A0A9P3LY69_9FUNG|nr:hypothetical protein EMPS_07474 [Entomortierella parvispora]
MGALQIPEILKLIALHLLPPADSHNIEDLLHLSHCAKVSRLWRSIFLDSLWYNVDDNHPAFRDLIRLAAFYSMPATQNPKEWSILPQQQPQPSGQDHGERSRPLIYCRVVPTPIQSRAREIWDRHQHRIRALHIHHHYTIDLALESSMGHLLELMFYLAQRNDLHTARSWAKTILSQPLMVSTDCPLIPAFDSLDPHNPPSDAFSRKIESRSERQPIPSECALDLTRACWRLALNNPNLVSLSWERRYHELMILPLQCADIRKGWDFHEANAEAVKWSNPTAASLNYASVVFSGVTDRSQEESRWGMGLSKLDSTGELFLTRALATLKDLKHLALGTSADDCVILRVLTKASSNRSSARCAGSKDGMTAAVRSYTYSSRSMFPLYQLWYVKDPLGFRYQNCHIQALDMTNLSMECRHLRLLLELFPCVEKLRLLRCLEDCSVAPLSSQDLAYHDLLVKEFRSPGFNPSRSAPFSKESESFLVHQKLKTMRIIGGLSGLATCPVVFQALTDLTIPNCRSMTHLWNHLQRMPRLESLFVVKLIGQESHRDRRVGFSRGGPIGVAQPYQLTRLQKIRICHNMARPWSLASLMQYVPHLVRLELTTGSRTLVKALATGCAGTLEHIQFNLKETCYQEMTLLMTRCSRLRTIRGRGFMVRAQDMLTATNKLSWVCLGLEVLQCEIHEVPRLTEDQERILSYLSVEQRTTATGRATLTKERQAILSQYEHSQELQDRVLGAIGQLTALYHLDLGCQRCTFLKFQTEFVFLHESFPGLTFSADGQRETLDVHQYLMDDDHRGPDFQRHRRMDKPVPNTLSLSLDLGLNKLSNLSKLETLGIKALDHRLRHEEVKWMREKWPKLKRVLGLEGFKIKGIQFDARTTALTEHFKAAIPGIEIVEE